MTMPEAQAAPATTTAYGIPYITLSNVVAAPTASAVTVTFQTDASCLIALDWYPIDENISNSGTVTEGAAATNHSMTFTPGAGHQGHDYGFVIRLAPADTSGLTLRSYTGSIQLLGARTVAQQNALPVRFYQFGGTPPPGAGGTPGGYNWNTYTWSQYNPRGTTFPAP